MDEKTRAIVLEVENQVNTVTNTKVIVNSKPTLEEAKSYLTKVKGMQKVVKEKKEGITKPLNEALKNARQLFKPVEEKLESIEKELKAGMLKYSNLLEDERIKREQEALEKVNEGVDIDKATKKLENTTQIMSDIKTREITEVEITSKKDLSLDLLTPDLVEIKRRLVNDIPVSGARLIKRKIVVS